MTKITAYSMASLMFAGLGTLPPANASNFVPWAILGFIFQYVIRRRHFPFWAKYNCKCPADHISNLKPSPDRCSLCSLGCWHNCWRVIGIFLVCGPSLKYSLLPVDDTTACNTHCKEESVEIMFKSGGATAYSCALQTGIVLH